MRTYLCGGINGLSDTLARDWREYVKSRLPDTRDPMDRDYRGKETNNAAEIVHGDLADIDACDVVLAMCMRPSWGTAMEIYYAHSTGKPVIAVVGFDAKISPWLAYHSVATFADLGSAVTFIEAGNVRNLI